MRHKKSASTESFEAALEGAGPAEHYVLRLFITGTTPRSLDAIRNIRTICEREMKGRYTLEVIDLYQRPELAEGEQIVVAPTLLKKLPLPFRRIIGDLSNTERVLAGLDLVPRGVR